MGYNICHGHYFHATFKWGISLAISKSSHGPQLFDFNSWCAQDIIFDYWDGLGKDGWIHKNYKADTPMANVKWGASNTSYLEGSGEGCWRGGRVFWNKWKSSINYGKTKWIYTKTKHPSGCRCVSHQIGEAYANSKPTSAPKVVVMKEDWEPNIGLAILGEEKSKIHQFL